MGESAHRLVTRLEEDIRSLEIEFHTAYWDSQVDASPERERRRVALELELRRVKGDPESLRAIEAALDEGVHDPVLERQLNVLRLSFLGNQMDEERRARMVELSSGVENDFAVYRPDLDGHPVTDNDIEKVLRTSTDETERRAAWEASKEIGAVVAGRVRELARLRNAAARDLGYADYYHLSLELQELSEEWLFTLLSEVESLTDAPFRRWKADLDERIARRFGTTVLHPWHYADPFFQQLPPDGRVPLDEVLAGAGAPDLATETFAAWGIDLSGVMSRSDLYPRDGKSQHAFCIDVDRSGNDVRILANVVPGERWIEVMLHESGHAAYDVSIDDHLPYLLRRPAHIFVTEAIAILAGRIVRDPSWLTGIAGAAHQTVDPMADALESAAAAQTLLFARWALVMIHFERDLYLDPESDLDTRWWEYVERFQGIMPPPERTAPDWAAKVHIAAAPVYYQNYLLGEILASQLAAVCRRDAGGLVGVKEAGRFLSERVFHPGGLLRWNSLIEGATGSDLDPRYFAADVAG